MGLGHLLCCTLALAVLADVVLGQGYEDRGGRRRCPPTCRMHCPYGFQIDSRGCELCTCNRGPGAIHQTGHVGIHQTGHSVGGFPRTGHVGSVGGFPQHVQTYCPQGMVRDVSYPTCQLGGQWGSQCSRGYSCHQGLCCGYLSGTGGDSYRPERRRGGRGRGRRWLRD